MPLSPTKKLLTAGLCAATLGGSMVSFADPAEARNRRGAAVAAGVVGGLAVGALAAGAASRAYAEPAPAYRVRPAYGVRSHYVDEDCYQVRRRYVDQWGRTIVRRETVCE